MGLRRATCGVAQWEASNAEATQQRTALWLDSAGANDGTDAVLASLSPSQPAADSVPAGANQNAEPASPNAAILANNPIAAERARGHRSRALPDPVATGLSPTAAEWAEMVRSGGSWRSERREGEMSPSSLAVLATRGATLTIEGDIANDLSGTSHSKVPDSRLLGARHEVDGDGQPHTNVAALMQADMCQSLPPPETSQFSDHSLSQESWNVQGLGGTIGASNRTGHLARVNPFAKLEAVDRASCTSQNHAGQLKLVPKTTHNSTLASPTAMAQAPAPLSELANDETSIESASHGLRIILRYRPSQRMLEREPTKRVEGNSQPVIQPIGTDRFDNWQPGSKLPNTSPHATNNEMIALQSRADSLVRRLRERNATHGAANPSLSSARFARAAPKQNPRYAGQLGDVPTRR